MYAQGKRAWGICFRCGWQRLLNELKYEVVNQVETKRRVCSQCLDQDHPQNPANALPYLNKPEAIALYDARPDSPERADSRGFSRWKPITSGSFAVKLGRLRVI